MKRWMIAALILSLPFYFCTKDSTGPDDTGEAVYDDPTKLVLLYSDPVDGAVGEAARNYDGVYAGIRVDLGQDYETMYEYQISLTFNNRLNLSTADQALSAYADRDDNFRIRDVFSFTENRIKINTNHYGRDMKCWYKIIIDTTLEDIYDNRLAAPETLRFMPEDRLRITGVHFTNIEYSKTYDYDVRDTGPVIICEDIWPLANVYVFINSEPDSLHCIDKITSTLPDAYKPGTRHNGVMLLLDTTGTTMEPNSQYQITLGSGIKDLEGNVLGEERVIRVNTAAYDASLRMSSWSAYQDKCEFYVYFNHRTAQQEILDNIHIIPDRPFTADYFSNYKGVLRFVTNIPQSEWDTIIIYLSPVTDILGNIMPDTSWVDLSGW